jgi:hypothetical protein
MAVLQVRLDLFVCGCQHNRRNSFLDFEQKPAKILIGFIGCAD